MSRVDREPVFVLHRRAYRDSSLIVDLISLRHGRLAAVARAARRSRSAWSGLVEPFRPLEAGWTRRGELATLVMLESTSSPARLGGAAIWAGFYANELLLSLTARDDPEPDIFHAYAELVDQLGRNERFAPVLRRFEMALLCALGVAPDLGRCAESGQNVDPEKSYWLDDERGPLPHSGSGVGLSGRVLLALAGRQPLTPELESDALRVMRQLIDHQLGGRALRTPALYRELNP